MKTRAIAIAGVLAFAPAAHADDGPPRRHVGRFGQRGSVVVSSDASAGGEASTHAGDDGTWAWGAALLPELDWFVARHLSLGIATGVSHADFYVYDLNGVLDRRLVTYVGAAPRVGVDIPLGDHFSIYPRASVGFEHVDTKTMPQTGVPFLAGGPAPETSLSANSATLELFVPLLIHPGDHFFVGAGPTVFHAFGPRGSVNAGERTTVGGHVVFGVWFGGDDEPAADGRTEDDPAYGGAGQIVLGNEFGISVAHTAFGGGSRTRDAIAVSPGFDWFVVRGLSLGLGGSYSNVKDVEQHVTAASIAPRVGYNVPLASRLSLHPRVSLRFETAHVEEIETFNVTSITPVLYVPLVLRPASHAIIGFGPYASRDASKNVDRAISNGVATALGASLIIGGWL